MFQSSALIKVPGPSEKQHCSKISQTGGLLIPPLHLFIPTEVDPAILTGGVTETLRRTAEDVHVVCLEGHQVGVVQLVVVPEVTANNLTFEEFKQFTVFNG